MPNTIIISVARKVDALQNVGTVSWDFGRQSTVESFASSFCGVIFGLRIKGHLKRKV